MGTQFQVRLSRNPLRFRGEDTESVRDWLLHSLEELVHAGKLEALVRFIGEDWYEDASVEHVLDLGARPLLAAFFLRALARPEVLGGYMIGELDGSAIALCWEDAGTWWLAQRAFEDDDFVGPWLIDVGEGVQALPADLRTWIDPGEAEVESLSEERRIPEDDGPDIRASITPRDGEWPDGLSELCETLAIPLEARILMTGLDHFKVVAVRPDHLEQWEVRGDLPCSVSDFVRAVAQQGETLAIAVMHAGVVRGPEGAQKAILTTLERDGRRGTRALVFSTDDEGKQVVAGALFEDRGEPGDDGWLGIAPTNDPGLRPLGTMGLGMSEPGEA